MAKRSTPPFQLAAYQADDVVPVTKSATLDVWGGTYSDTNTKPSNGLLVGTAGAADIITAAGNTRSNVPLQAGYNPLREKAVLTTGTSSASDIWAIP